MLDQSITGFDPKRTSPGHEGGSASREIGPTAQWLLLWGMYSDLVRWCAERMAKQAAVYRQWAKSAS
jgi:hypothetical protein